MINFNTEHYPVRRIVLFKVGKVKSVLSHNSCYLKSYCHSLQAYLKKNARNKMVNPVYISVFCINLTKSPYIIVFIFLS